MRHGWALRAIGCLTLLPTAALAQTEASIAGEDVPGASAEVADAPGLPLGDEIVVTAQRRSESLQDVPISLKVVSGSTLQDRSIQNFEQLAPMVPNLTVAKSPAANLIILRGIGSSPASPSLDQSVVMFIDGIYAGNARQFATPFLDVERLEILRGPQGALVGRNTSAGAINIITREPGEDFGGYLFADYSFDYDGPTVEGGLDIPVSENLKLRVVGKYSDVEGYIYNRLVDENHPSREERIGRATLVYDDGGPVRVRAKYEHAEVDVRGLPVELFAPNSGQFLDYRKATGPEYDDLRTDNAVLQFDIDLGVRGWSRSAAIPPFAIAAFSTPTSTSPTSRPRRSTSSWSSCRRSFASSPPPVG